MERKAKADGVPPILGVTWMVGGIPPGLGGFCAAPEFLRTAQTGVAPAIARSCLLEIMGFSLSAARLEGVQYT